MAATRWKEENGTQGAVITLDNNAARYGWFADWNFADTSDYFLPTSNLDVWMAKPDSAAADKMDLLSVLLHEYGHALGLDTARTATTSWAPRCNPASAACHRRRSLIG